MADGGAPVSHAQEHHAPELATGKDTALVFDVRRGLVVVHKDSKDKQLVEISVYQEDDDERPKYKFDRASIKWEDFIYGVKRALGLDANTTIEVKTQLGQEITKKMLRKIKDGWNVIVTVTGKERKQGQSSMRRNMQNSQQIDGTLRAAEWNKRAPELNGLQLLQSEWNFLANHPPTKFMLGYAIDQPTYEGEMVPQLRSMLQDVDKGNSTLNRERLKQVQLELDAVQTSAEQALEDTAEFRKEVSSSRSEFVRAFFANVFIVNNLLPWLEGGERAVYMSAGKEIRATTQNVVNWGTNKMEEQEEIDRLVAGEYKAFCTAIAHGQSAIDAAHAEAEHAQRVREELAHLQTQSSQLQEQRWSMQNNGEGPLWHASKENNVSVVQWLLSTGISLELTDHIGCTALHIAAHGNCHECIALLLEAKAPVDRRDTFARTPMWMAAHAGGAASLELLLKAGADPNLPNMKRCTAVFTAARKGSHAVVKILAEAGADLEAEGTHSHTPLMAAAYYGHVEVCKTLVEHGANLSARCGDAPDGNTAYQWATMSQRDDCAAVLKPKKWGLVQALRSQGHTGKMDAILPQKTSIIGN